MVDTPLDLTPFQTPLRSYLTQFLAEQAQEYQDYAWTSEVFPRLTEFVTTGKLLRGCLVLMSGRVFGLTDQSALLPLAAAMELMQSSGLIHDDITDHDTVRRGKPSIFAQYQTLADERQYHGQRVGEGLAIWVGDIGFFLAFLLLGRLQTSIDVMPQLIKVFAEEYVKVGLGQLHDIHLGLTPTATTESEILSVYQIKTARYTMALPILLTGILAKADPALLPQLTELAETIGLIFQLKDDELGLFGTEAQIGKPVISDVREGKKTLFYLWGLALATPEQRTKLESLFGKSDLSMAELEEVKTMVTANGATQKVATKIASLADSAQAQIAQLADSRWQAFFQPLLAMNLERKK